MLDEDGVDLDAFTIVEGEELVVSRTAFSSNQSKYDDGKAATFKEVGALREEMASIWTTTAS